MSHLSTPSPQALATDPATPRARVRPVWETLSRQENALDQVSDRKLRILLHLLGTRPGRQLWEEPAKLHRPTLAASRRAKSKKNPFSAGQSGNVIENKGPAWRGAGTILESNRF